MILENTIENGFVLSAITVAEANLDISDDFKEEMLAQIDAGHYIIVLDFKKVTYVDSSFLGALVSSLKHAISKKGDVILINLKKDIHDLLKLIRMDKVFKIYENREDAIKALAQ